MSDSTEEVTIIIDGEQIEFKGDEAKRLIKKLKRSAKAIDLSEDVHVLLSEDGKKLKWIGKDDEAIDIDKLNDKDFLFPDDEECDSTETGEMVRVVVEDGVRTVTINKCDKGEKSSKTLTGSEAEDYFKNLKGRELMEDIDLDDKGTVHFYKGDNDSCGVMKKHIKPGCCDDKNKKVEKIIIKKKNKEK